MPGFHVHSKSRSGGEAGETGGECDEGSFHSQCAAGDPSTGPPGVIPLLEGPKPQSLMMSAAHEFLGHSCGN